jgi:hypothetical protein
LGGWLPLVGFTGLVSVGGAIPRAGKVPRRSNVNSLQFRASWMVFAWLLSAPLALSTGGVAAQEPEPAVEPPAEPRKADPAGLTRIAKDYDVWIDVERKLVVVDGKVCLRRGPLEMFACPRGTKEHEAIVSVNSPAQFVHAGLLAVGALKGKPVSFRPEYSPASGTVIDVWVLWKDKDGMNHKVRAQQWIKNAVTEKEMEYNWVFGGSGFWTDEETGERHYHADGGDFICVSNFSTAMMDLPVESSQANSELLFTAFTERIPPMGTEVRLVLVPRIERKPASSGEGSAPSSDAPASGTPPAVAPPAGNAPAVKPPATEPPATVPPAAKS